MGVDKPRGAQSRRLPPGLPSDAIDRELVGELGT
jgi:hypothetical protein